MTDNEIIKALIGKINLCKELNSWGAEISLKQLNEILDLIKRQQAENEELLHSVKSLSGLLSSAKFEAVYKYMKILEAKLAQNNDISGFAYQSVIWDMSQSYSEMVGDTK